MTNCKTLTIRKLKQFSLDDSIKDIDDTKNFWISLYKIQIDGVYPFRCVSEFILKTLSLPHSLPDCERVFSKVNLIKTKIRS